MNDAPGPRTPSPSPAESSSTDPHLGWALFALALGGLGIGSTEFAIMGLLPQVADGLDVDIPTAGHIISSYALGVVVGAPVLAALTARWERRFVLLCLMAMFTVGNFASAVAPDYGLMLLARFMTGVPHGAYFGIAMVVGATLAGPARRGFAVSMVMMGLTIANVVSVPLLTLLGQNFGWRWAFHVVAGIGAVTVLMILLLVPTVPAASNASVKRELGALRRLQVWLALGTGMVGFGGFFAVYSYIAPTLTEVSGFSDTAITGVLSVYGIGMTLGNYIGGKAADKSVMGSVYAFSLVLAGVLVLFALTVPWKPAAVASVFLVGAAGSAFTPPLQTRLMDVARDAQNLAASLNHSALNVANALGAWLGGLVIAAGFGYVAPAWVGVALALGGLAIALVSGRIPAHK